MSPLPFAPQNHFHPIIGVIKWTVRNKGGGGGKEEGSRNKLHPKFLDYLHLPLSGVKNASSEHQ
jgi:hypothetical protein